MIRSSCSGGPRLFPLSELDHGQFFPGIDEGSEICLVETWVASFGPMPHALANLILGVMPCWFVTTTRSTRFLRAARPAGAAAHPMDGQPGSPSRMLGTPPTPYVPAAVNSTELNAYRVGERCVGADAGTPSSKARMSRKGTRKNTISVPNTVA